MRRCPWCGSDPLLVRYHDEEWGVPVHEDQRHFEFLLLEGAQAGLSWLTILRKREAYRQAYRGFDPVAVASFGPREVERLLGDPGIVRNRLKIQSSISNARSFLEVQSRMGSFDRFLWELVGGRPVVGSWKRLEEVPARTPLSDRLSRQLGSLGFRFVGPTIVYAYLQAVGAVNDHLVDCFRYRELAENPWASRG
ncbi:MAG: DNA-3-methyladenine glycosylase I [Spirochaetales bacterium]|nr:DNA-3-methyladenine glycosylase I [Spirochaetales bacterium]